MLRLHARRWAARGMRGAFADPWFERFHRRLILSRLAHGEIQLVRVRSGGTTLGCLYNLVYRGRVMFYQSGLASFEDKHVKPGYICQAAAIEYNALAGHSTYELLGGNATYKDNLATGANRLLWLRVQRPAVRFATSVEDNVRRWYDLIVGNREQLALRPA
jgi:CelD/BcsL family acetyltransferase involved in cellulose biosynthesis